MFNSTTSFTIPSFGIVQCQTMPEMERREKMKKKTEKSDHSSDSVEIFGSAVSLSPAEDDRVRRFYYQKSCHTTKWN